VNNTVQITGDSNHVDLVFKSDGSGNGFDCEGEEHLDVLDLAVASLHDHNAVQDASLNALVEYDVVQDAVVAALGNSVSALVARDTLFDLSLAALVVQDASFASFVTADLLADSSVGVHLTALDTSVSTLNTHASALDTSVSTLNTHASALDTSVSKLNIYASALDVSVNALNTRASRLDVSVNALNTRASALDVSVNALAPILNTINVPFKITNHTLDGIPNSNFVWKLKFTRANGLITVNFPALNFQSGLSTTISDYDNPNVNYIVSTTNINTVLCPPTGAAPISAFVPNNSTPSYLSSILPLFYGSISGNILTVFAFINGNNLKPDMVLSARELHQEP